VHVLVQILCRLRFGILGVQSLNSGDADDPSRKLSSRSAVGDSPGSGEIDAERTPFSSSRVGGSYGAPGSNNATPVKLALTAKSGSMNADIPITNGYKMYLLSCLRVAVALTQPNRILLGDYLMQDTYVCAQ
jgi:hypothetical protein